MARDTVQVRVPRDLWQEICHLGAEELPPQSGVQVAERALREWLRRMRRKPSPRLE